MAVLTDTSLSRLGDWITRNVLKDDCTILRNSPTPTSSGGMTDHWTAVGSGQKCALLDAGSPAQQAEAAQTVGYITKTVLLARGTDVRGDDRVQIGSLTYTIIDIFEPSSYEVCRRALVRRSSIQTGA